MTSTEYCVVRLGFIVKCLEVSFGSLLVFLVQQLRSTSLGKVYFFTDYFSLGYMQ